MPTEPFSTLLLFLPYEATSCVTDYDYRGETTISLSVAEGAKTVCLRRQEMKS